MATNWAEVYRATYGPLFRFLRRKVWDEERAHDLTQEAFARGLDHEPENPRAWLFQVASNLARDEARLVIRRKRHLALLKVEVGASAPCEPQPAADLARKEKQEHLRELLDGLSSRDREVLLLWDAGLSYTEIAEQVGIASGAVGTTLARARRRLIEAHTAREEKHAARG
jgi:RNA polymerase sigma-70 factor, ECF subfamily